MKYGCQKLKKNKQHVLRLCKQRVEIREVIVPE